MIFQLLWSLIGIFSILGYLFLWLQQRFERANAISSKSLSPNLSDEEYLNNLIHISPNVASKSQENDAFVEPESITTNLDDDNKDFGNLDISQYSDVTDLDELESTNMSDSLERSKLHYERSFDATIEDVTSDFLSNDDFLNFIKKCKPVPCKKYYANCTINCKDNSEIIKITEGSAVSIEDADNLDYWINYSEDFPIPLSIVPRCCLSDSPDGGNLDSDNRKRNPRETFREDILKISNKNQESTIKRKYALADLIECDREYCATLKLIKDILMGLDKTENDFGVEIDLLFEDVCKLIAEFVEFHENLILPELSSCVLIPIRVANVLKDQKSKFSRYSELQSQWKKLKDLLDFSKKKYIFVKNTNTSEKSKFSLLSFNDLMMKVENKLPQYNLFLFDIIRYTGRIDGEVYNLQKAITAFQKIRRRNKENVFLGNLLEETDIKISNERFIRVTGQVMISETQIMSKSYENLQFIREEMCSVILLKNYLICVQDLSQFADRKIMNLEFTKIYTKENYERQNELILWSKLNKLEYRIFILYFPNKVSKLGWLRDIMKRLKKKGIDGIFVSSIEYDIQYQQYLGKYQRLVATEMESLGLESASLENECSSISDQIEDLTSMADSITDYRFESAVLDIPSSITSGSYKTAPETFKSTEGKASRPVSGISQDSVSTLDGVRTPFSDEELIRSVLIISDIEEINISEGSDLVWSLKLVNFDPILQDIKWSLSGKTLDVKSQNTSMKIEEQNNKVYECELKRQKLTKLESGQLSCKLIDKINGSLIVSKIVNVFISPPCVSIELSCELTEVTVLENDPITFQLISSVNCLKSSILNHLTWYKDNERIDSKDTRIKTFINPSNNKIILTIERASISDAGIYTVNCVLNSEIFIKNLSNISILLLVEKLKKTIYKTASLENQPFIGDSHVQVISPLKELINLGNEYEGSNLYSNAVSSMMQLTESDHKPLSGNIECEIEEIDLKIGELLSLQMKPINIPLSTLNLGSWYLNSEKIDLKILNGSEEISENQININIPGVLKEFSGSLQFRIENPLKIFSPEVTIKIRASNLKSKPNGYFFTNVKRIETISGENLQIQFKAYNISLDLLKDGFWFLNRKVLDLKKWNGLANLSESQVEINIPKSTNELSGIWQFQIDKPIKLISPEVIIDVLIKEVTPLSTGFLDCEIEEIDLKVGETLSLTLIAVNIQLTTLKNGGWFLNSKPIYAETFSGNELVKENKVEIVIPNVTKEFSGLLQYRIEKPVVLHSPEIIIKIRGNLMKHISKVEPDKIETDLILELHNVALNILENERIFLEAKILSGDTNSYQTPPQWFWNDETIKNINCKKDFNNNVAQLEIPQCQLNDAGQYKICFNPLATSKCSKVAGIFLVSIVPVKKNLKPIDSNIETSPGESVTLCVDVEGFSKKDIKWKILGDDCKQEQILQEERIIQKFNNNLSFLLIDCVKLEDSGTYICQGFTNKELISECKITLTVVPNMNDTVQCQVKFEKENYSVDLNEEITLRALIDCTSTHYSVSWFFNGEILEMKSDFLSDIKNNGKIAELKIKNCNESYGGTYECMIENKDGDSSIAKTELNVENIKIDSFKFTTKNIEIIEGNELDLEVVSEFEKNLEFQWSKDDVDCSCDGTFISTENQNCFNLKKLSAEITDSGIYKFERILDNKPLELVLFTVQVNPIQDIITTDESRLKLICEDREIVVSNLKPLIISVEVLNWKQGIVQWFRNDQAFGEPYQLDNQFIDLYVESPQINEHSGLYKCVVMNEKSEKESVEITVKFESDNAVSPASGELLFCTVEEVNTIEDEKIELSVESRIPTKSIESALWLKDEQPLNESDPRLTIIMQPFCYNLILRNVKMTDAGTYSLKMNDNSVDILVKVRPKPIKKQTKEIFKNLKIPQIKKPLQNIFIKSEPETVKFEFEVQECGTTKAIWFFENEEIETENIEFIQWSCENYFALTIPTAGEKHCGKYTIQVTNDMGCIKSDGRLSLMLRSEIPEQLTESCCIAPLFTKKLKDIEILSKESIRLNCRMMCDPKPKILWTKDGETLDSNCLNKRIKILDEFPNLILIITEVEVEDSGRYCCLGTNFLGYDTTESMVTVTDSEQKEDDSSRIIVKPLCAPVLTADYSKGADIILSWTGVAIKDSLNVTYNIEKQKSLTSTNWKKIIKGLTNTTCSLSSSSLSPHESHLLRCIAISDYGFETVSNIIEVPIRANSPVLPPDKPTIVFKDATCVKISWLRGKCKNLTPEESIGKILYSLEMKDNPKSSWQIVSNELVDNEYSLSLEPGVSYMFRVVAFNDFGISEASQSLISRIDRLKLVPDFCIDPPWLHLKGQPCLKWRAATVPEFCDSCVGGILPDYKVEYRNGRLSPWKIYQENIIQNEIYLTQKIIDDAQEFRVSCRNKFGQNGPTRSYRLQANIVGKTSYRSPSVEKAKTVIKYDQLKQAEIESISKDGLSLKWSPWAKDQINKYIIQRRNSFSQEWEQIHTTIFGENCFIEIFLSENFSRQLRILSLDDKTELHDGYNILHIPSKEDCIPTIPESLQVNDLINYHEIYWSESKSLEIVDSPITYSLQSKINNQFWFTITEKLDKCFYTNTRIDKYGVTGYRVSARNSIGSSQFSAEIFTKSLINILSNEQVIKSLRYFVINPREIEIKWHLCESIFDSGLTTEDLSFQIEKKTVKEGSNWVAISNIVEKNSILISILFEDENLFRIQPYYRQERLTASRIFRMYISKDLLVPDMSFTRPNIVIDSMTSCIIEWSEPELQSGFSPDGIEICVPSVLLVDLQYDIQYVEVDPVAGSKIRGKDVKNLEWKCLQESLEENTFEWENPDPTQEYLFRIVAKNQFGSGLPSQIVKLHPQIIIPDFSFVRLTIDDTVVPGSNGEREIMLSWSPPRTSPDLYIPYTVDVEYRQVNYSYSDDEGWKVFKTNVKKNRINITDLDPFINYQIRIVPVTDFGTGKPSMAIKRIRRSDNLNSPTVEKAVTLQEKQCLPVPMFCCLSQKAELKFTKLMEHKLDQITWTFNKSKVDVNNGDKYDIFSSETYDTYFVIKNLEEDDFGEYSALDEGQDPIQSFILIKSDAPTILNCLPNWSLTLHENFSISVKIDAQPPPEVVWRRNWKKIFSSYRTIIYEDKEQGTYSLLISKCILSDGGEYSIRAENAIGFAEVKFNLRVDAHPEKKSVQINNGDVNDRYYTMKKLAKGSYSRCQIVIEKSTQIEFVGKFFEINNMGIGKSEFHCIQSINHRNIVEIFDAISMPDQYLVLIYEKLQGLSLAEYISQLSHWCESQVRIIIHQLIQAVSHLHEHGVCHLDIKPENIIMTGKYNEIVKLCGFSNAVPKEDFGGRRHMSLTSPFSAPELLKGESIQFNSDMWSIGILTFLCLHGHLKVNFEGDQLYYEDSNDTISNSACVFIRKCLLLKNGERLTSSDSLNHEWFIKPDKDLNAALDYIIEQIVKLMTYPEEMVPNFPSDMKNAIETLLIDSRPKVIFNSSLSNPEGSISPPISQLSSRASSASRDGINYERCDTPNDNSSEEIKSDRSETFPSADRFSISNTTKELLFTVPLKDQTFKSDSTTSKIAVTLTCQLSLLGSEPISISWYKNQELLTDDSKIKLEVIKGGFLSCTILNATETDVGVYRCIARCHSLRTETTARLVLGDVPPQPEHLSVFYSNHEEVVLKWYPYLSAIDDVIYRIDIKTIDQKNKNQNWNTIGYSVDNRYLLENLDSTGRYIARIIAQNKYGYSPYSIATSVFQNKTRNIHNLKQNLIFNRKWMLSTRQSNHFNDLHDLIKDISSDDIRINVIREHYDRLLEKASGLAVLKLKNTSLNYPEYIVQRTFKMEEIYPAFDLCVRIKYYHFPILFGEIRDTSLQNRITFEEFVPGGNLLSVLLARSVYSEFTVVTIIRQLLGTIQFLHSNNVVHGNIEPMKILISRRTNQSFDIKLIGLENCQFVGTVKEQDSVTTHKPSIFKAPEYRYESNTRYETDIWSLGILAFLLLTTQLPAIEDACSDSDVQCCVKNTNTLLLPVPHTHFRPPKLSLLHKFSKSARKFVHNSLKKSPNDRGNADYWLAHSWFKQDSKIIYEMEHQTISSSPLVDFINANL